MDGSNFTVLVQNSTTYHPVRLAVDASYLYWSDKLDMSIKQVSLDGENSTEEIVRSIINPMDVVVYENFIYWSNGTTGQVKRLDRATGKHYTMYPNAGAGHAIGLTMVSTNDKS